MKDHVEDVVTAVSTAVRTLLATADVKKIEQRSQYATVVAYFVESMVRVDIKPRKD